ncbi:MAG TPA: hypothetical protein PLK31_18790 [Chloroflexota bacterium]|nr:hypothetical protein [Chloroflexota bacterium]
MASTQPLNKPSILDTPETNQLPGYGRVAFLNGFLIGLAVCVGYWGPKLAELHDLPGRYVYSGVIVSSFLIILLCTLVSWLTARLNNGLVTVLSWLVTAVLITLIFGYIPALTFNWLVWLNDTPFRGLPVSPVPARSSWWAFPVAGMLLIFLLFVLAILQELRLGRAYNQLGPQGRLSGWVFMALLLPILLAGWGAYAMPDHMGNAPRQAMRFVYQGIETVREYDGDLFALSKQEGFNYSALNGVREQLEGPYTLLVGEVDPEGLIITVVALFDSGVWLQCQVYASEVQANYLSFCADASRPYTDGFYTLLTGRKIAPHAACPRQMKGGAPGCKPALPALAMSDPNSPTWRSRAAMCGCAPPLLMATMPLTASLAGCGRCSCRNVWKPLINRL